MTGADIATSVNGIAAATRSALTKQLRNKLKQGAEDLTFLVQGDSTGNGDNEWVVQTFLEIAARNPLYNLAISFWNQATDYYPQHKYYQIGTNGESHIPMLKGTSGAFGVENVGNALDFTDLDV